MPDSRQIVQESAIVVTRHMEGDTEHVRSYDFRNHSARHAFLRFTSWAIRQGIDFAVEPGEVATPNSVYTR